MDIGHHSQHRMLASPSNTQTHHSNFLFACPHPLTHVLSSCNTDFHLSFLGIALHLICSCSLHPSFHPHLVNRLYHLMHCIPVYYPFFFHPLAFELVLDVFDFVFALRSAFFSLCFDSVDLDSVIRYLPRLCTLPHSPFPCSSLAH